MSKLEQKPNTGSKGSIKIAPSVLAANFADLKTALHQVREADYLHLDVMDGHFVPNLSIGVPVVASIRKACDLFLDVHLMISDPAFYVEAFIKAGADLLCVHDESFDHPEELLPVLEQIKASGVQTGLALKPATPIDVVFPLFPYLDMVLVMTVEPGFGGQAFQSLMLDKVRALRKEATLQNRPLEIQVDGGINRQTGALAVAAGATVLVAGEAIFGREDPAAELRALRAECSAVAMGAV